MTGEFYLAVFAGGRGVAESKIFTINPGFIGSIVSRTPKRVKSA